MNFVFLKLKILTTVETAPNPQSGKEMVVFGVQNKNDTCGLSVTTFFYQVLNYYYLTVYIMFKPKMSLEGSVH